MLGFAGLDPTGLCMFDVEEDATSALRCTARVPQPGRTAYASILIETHDADSGQDGLDALTLRARCLDETGRVLSAVSESVARGESGEVSASVVVPTGCVDIAWEMYLDIGSQPPGGIRTIDFRTPTLRLAGPGVSNL